MKKLSLNPIWQFKFASTTNDWWNKFDTKVVDLPHDFSISQARSPHTKSGASNGFFPGGVGVYEKTIHIPKEWQGKKLMLEFEGVYMNSTVRLNNQVVGKNPYGYTSFHCDLTKNALFGRDNIIKVTVNNDTLPNTRWYSGSGIYRNVWLLIGESIHIKPWGVFVTTPDVTDTNSLISVKTSILNDGGVLESIVVRSTILDRNDVKIADFENLVDIESQTEQVVEQTLIVKNPILWSLQNPYLYRLKSEIIKDGFVIDSSETNFGIRTISVSATEGFKLNNEHINLKGGCVHHDCGILGAASFERAEERKVELLLKSGFNSVRCAHNPPSVSFLDACDRLGLLVINEAFDCWRESKNPNDYGVYFDEFWKKDMESMVLRDRNHPSIIMWSTGNEIGERDGRNDGYKLAKELAAFVREIDSSRPVTNALCPLYQGNDDTVALLSTGLEKLPENFDYLGELTAPFAEPLDVSGYNYMLSRYEIDHEKYPDRIICATETFPMDAFDCWDAVERLPYVIGDFVWTSIDYLGESGIGHVWYNGEKNFLGDYPWHTAFCGDIDICGYKRPQSYYRDCVWGEAKAPYIAVHKPEHFGKTADISRWGWPDVVSSWTWNGFEEKSVAVDVYSMCEEVELLLNGEVIGREKAGRANKYTASFELKYVPGVLVAIGLEAGVEISRSELLTAGEPKVIKLTPDRSEISTKYGDLSFIAVELLDEKGNLTQQADNELYFSVYGEGSILAVGNSNPLSEEMYIGNCRKAHEGRAMLVVKTNGNPGDIYVTASGNGLKTEIVKISAEHFTTKVES